MPRDKIGLKLDGDVLNHQGQYQGNYLLSNNGSINGHVYWYQQNGNHGIWFGQSWISWIFGHINDLGQEIGYIFGPYGQGIKWPTEISNGYWYWNFTSWVLASSNDLKFLLCKYKSQIIPKGYTAFIMNHTKNSFSFN